VSAAFYVEQKLCRQTTGSGLHNRFDLQGYATVDFAALGVLLAFLPIFGKKRRSRWFL
jgi:hypothetical protein